MHFPKLGHIAASLFVFSWATVFCYNDRQHFIASRSPAQSFHGYRALFHTHLLSQKLYSGNATRVSI